VWSARAIGAIFHSTFLINIPGSFVIGYLCVLFMVDWRDRYGSALNSLWLTGFLGGYTTFSSMQLDAAKLAGNRGGVSAASYLVLSVVSGLLAAALGAAFARVQG